jgi:pimeloyl-ACP methyl ester carboxylesterase
VTEHIQIPTEVGTFDAIAAGPEDGRGVLLLHGFPEAGIEWEYQVSALGSAGFRAVAPDQRGYSPAVRPEEVDAYRVDELSADVLRIADALGWSRFDLAGHDWGSAVAWITAGDHPERLRTLTAVSVPHPGSFGAALRQDEDQQRRSMYMQTFRQTGTAERGLLAEDAAALRRMFEYRVPRSRVEEYVRRLSEPGALTAALNWYRAKGRSTDQVTVPTLFVWSTEDVAIGSTAALANADQVTGPYRFEMLEDISHWIPEEAAQDFTALLLDHLRTYS